jgi:hypothetical protein
MKATQLIAVSALAALTSLGAMAGEATPPEVAVQQAFTSTVTRAEVRAQAVQAAANKNMEPAGSRVQVFGTTQQTRDAVRAEAEHALRTGQILAGERTAG